MPFTNVQNPHRPTATVSAKILTRMTLMIIKMIRVTMGTAINPMPVRIFLIPLALTVAALSRNNSLTSPDASSRLNPCISKYLMTVSGGSPQKIFALASCCAWAGSICPGSGAARRGPVVGATGGGGVAMRMRVPLVRAAGTGGCEDRPWAMATLAAMDPSAPQTGQTTALGINSPAVSTSNA